MKKPVRSIIAQLRSEHIRLSNDDANSLIFSYERKLKLDGIKAEMRIIELFLEVQEKYSIKKENI